MEFLTNDKLVIVGAGGAFIITPILLAIFKLPMNTVVANSITINIDA